MSRKIAWRESKAGTEKELVDHIGMLGPFRTFVLAQDIDKKAWTLTSVWIPTKHRRKVFSNVEVGKVLCQKIVDDFSAWLRAD